jgi:hypothetical protein
MTVDAPEPRNIAQEGRESLEAQIELEGPRLGAAQQYRPGWTDLDLKTLRQSLMGSAGTPGLMDIYSEAGPRLAGIAAQGASGQREADVLDIERYGQRATAAVRAADQPTAQLEDLLTQQAMQGLQSGASLDPDMRRQVEQSIRSGQAARGFGMGAPDVSAEALFAGQEGEKLRRARQAYAQSVLAQRRAGAVDPFLAILGRPSQSVGQLQSLGGQGGAMGQGMSSFDPFSGYASQLNSQNFDAQLQTGMANAQMMNSLIGSGISAAGSIGGGAMGCWVARAVYGERDARWLIFRHWLTTRAPRWFRALYMKHGPSVAAFIERHAWLKPLVRTWMNRRIHSYG